MSDALLAELASCAGFELDWIDANGRPQRITPEVQRHLLETLGYPAGSAQQMADSLASMRARQEASQHGPLLVLEQNDRLCLAPLHPAGQAYQLCLEDDRVLAGRLDQDACLRGPSSCGYHRLRLGEREYDLAVCPSACPSSEQLTGRAHAWGLNAQLYSLRRPGDGGLGDTLALEQLARSAAAQGADALAISPVHAMFSANGEQYSPYSPSSRLNFNVLHSSPAQILGEAALARALAASGQADEFARLESCELLDWPALTRTRLLVWRQLYQDFISQQGALHLDFMRFLDLGGEALRLHCRFEAIHAHMLGKGDSGDWRHWPEALRDPQHGAVQRLAQEYSAEVEFHAFAQWLLVRGLERAQLAAMSSGMGIGLIADLAVGADCAGSQAWACQSQLLPGMSVGAPPDILNRSGQSWGVWAFSPLGLKESGYTAFLQMLRASFACAGGIRIDHIMGLQRLWVLPQGAPADMGAYLRYPLQDLLRLLSLEAWRHQALVIGEDLGTVPPGLREQLERRNILGMRVLLFEQAQGAFIPPQHWSKRALATTGTHDLPTIRGWLEERDIAWRLRAGHSSEERAAHDREERQHERQALLRALQEAAQLASEEDHVDACVTASIGYIGQTPAPLVLLPLEDALGTAEQPNLPGPGDIHPNWRRRWTIDAQQLLEQPNAQRNLQCLIENRDRAGGPDHA